MVTYAQRNELFTGEVWEVKNKIQMIDLHIRILSTNRLLDMPSFKLANSWYDQSFSEILAFQNPDPDTSTLRR